MKKLFVIILLGTLAFSCIQEKKVQLKFAAEVAGTPLSCDQWYHGYDTTANAGIQIKDFRFYVSDIRLINDKEEEVPLILEQDSIWQFKDIALLDFENAMGECEEKGTVQTNSVVKGSVTGGDFKSIIFKLGVPFEWNHVDNVAVPSPLNVGAMFWNWQYGYKFARFDLVTDQPDDQKFWFIHLGSTGCEAGKDGLAPDEPCLKTNIPEIRIDNFDIEKDMIVADLDALIKGLTIGTCMSGTENPHCKELFPRFGLSLASGECEGDCQQQALFYKKGESQFADASH